MPRAVLRRLVRGVSTRKYEQVVDLAREGFGVKKSSVSRGFVRALAQVVRALAERRYRHTDGTPTREADNIRLALRPLRSKFGDEPVATFGTLKLYELQAALARTRLSRRTINSRVKKVCRFFRWCAGRELIDAGRVDAMYKSEPVAPGQGGRETLGRRSPVPWSRVEATLPYVPELLGQLPG